MNVEQDLRYALAPGQEPDASDGLDPLTHIRLWQNPCWLSARLNILANRFNIPMYGWIEERFGLSRPEFVVLYTLNLSPETPASAISLSTGFPKNTLSRAIQRLSAEGLVVRRDDPNDGRSFQLVLTSRGKAIVDEALPRLYDHERRMMDALSDREKRLLSTVLAKMVASLERDAAEPADAEN